MKLYRLITGFDDSAFCHRITAALNSGWSLHGSPSLTYDPRHRRPVCAQAIVKDVPTLDYDPQMKLGDY
jgi:hypothetical protein